MADGAADGEGEDVVEDGRVGVEEGEGGEEFRGFGCRGGDGCCGGLGEEEEGGEVWGEEEIGGCEEGGEGVLGDHHLRARVGFVGAEDVVLGAVCQAVEEEVDA